MSARYHAPAVSYAFSRPRWAGVALALVGLALACALGAWCLRAPLGGWHLAMAAMAFCTSVWLLYQQWRGWPQGRILWDGAAWLHEAQVAHALVSQHVQLHVGLDGGQWLWVRLQHDFDSRSLLNQRGVLWIFISGHQSPAQWGDLRRAVYSSVAPLTEQG